MYKMIQNTISAPEANDTQIDGLVQDCNVLAMELLQSCTKPSRWYLQYLRQRQMIHKMIQSTSSVTTPTVILTLFMKRLRL